MISLSALLGMVATDAITGEYSSKPASEEPATSIEPRGDGVDIGVSSLPPINYRLELIRNSDGTLEWVE